MIHLILHVIVPVLFAYIFYREEWKKASIILVGGYLVDLDHLLADPIYAPDRCSIGFHPLHSYIAIGIYFCMLFIPKVRLIAWALVIHMVLDYIDCLT